MRANCILIQPKSRNASIANIDGCAGCMAVEMFETNTVVWASAGTGKTRKLVDVYLELLERGIDPHRIAAVTFTERAAAEMRDRIRTGLEARPGQWSKTMSTLAAAPISTIHGFCGILLRQHGI